jgi:hypothetical protein
LPWLSSPTLGSANFGSPNSQTPEWFDGGNDPHERTPSGAGVYGDQTDCRLRDPSDPADCASGRWWEVDRLHPRSGWTVVRTKSTSTMGLPDKTERGWLLAPMLFAAMTPSSHVPAIRRARSSTEVWQSVDLRDAEISKAQSVIGKPMNRRILTVVSATVDTNREAELVAGFRNLLVDFVPDGLLHTHLLKGANGRWQIQTLWRDRAALEKMRAASEPPAAPRLFRSVGADPMLQIFELMVEHVSTHE